jgi:hypothetical protein
MAIAVGTTITKIAAKLGVSTVPVVICTNSFSFYECLMKLGTTKEKRLIINIIAIRQAYEQQNVLDIRWIDDRNNPANAITKAGPNRAFEQLINNNKLIMRLQKWVKRNREKFNERKKSHNENNLQK